MVAVLGGGIWLGRRMLIRWIDGPTVAPSTAPWPPVPAAASRAAERSTAAAAHNATTKKPTTKKPTTKKAAAPTPKRTTGTAKRAPAAKATRGGRWVERTSSGACPDTHPVKVKLSSHLYHLPGMAAYDRTTPDRCYLSAEAAEAEGFARAKR